MDFSRRDLVVVSRPGINNKEDYEREVRLLHRLLQHAERWESFCAVHEIIDINRYKIIRKPWQIQQILQEKPMKPFVFLLNKN